MASNYDNSAWFYDSLSKVVYGKALINAQLFLLQYILPNSTILIAGGGTGWILEELTRIHPSGLKITYVEISANMMALSQKRAIGANEVVFIHEAIENVNLSSGFDVIITPFLFDNFTEQTLQKVFQHLHSLLKTGGIWLNTDFQLTGKWWQNVLLKMMFAFFKLICGIETSALPDVERYFIEYGYNEISQKIFYGEFVISKVLKKTCN
jgi:ubiquinone/menaquinone biosynthesis C-methylase UbiE